MKITQNAAVVMHYTLTDDTGAVVDSSRDQDPLSYIHGSGGLIPGLEEDFEALQRRIEGIASGQIGFSQ